MEERKGLYSISEDQAVPKETFCKWLHKRSGDPYSVEPKVLHCHQLARRKCTWHKILYNPVATVTWISIEEKKLKFLQIRVFAVSQIKQYEKALETTVHKTVKLVITIFSVWQTRNIVHILQIQISPEAILTFLTL